MLSALLEVDPNLVRPGWTPLVITLLLGVGLVFLGRSMLKQFGRIDVPADHEPIGDRSPDSGSATSGGNPGSSEAAASDAGSDDPGSSDPGSSDTVPEPRAREDQSHPPMPELRSRSAGPGHAPPPGRP